MELSVNMSKVFAFFLSIAFILSTPVDISEDSVNIPSTYDSLFKKYGEEQDIPWEWLKTIAMIESTLGLNPRVALGIKEPNNPKSVSYDNLSYGLMQLRVSTACDFEKGITFKDLNNPETSIRIAAKFFKWIKNQFKDKQGEELEKLVIMSYNQGVGGTKKGYKGALPYYEKFKKYYPLIKN